jgi:uncharacterized repeat protein (TIGR01451 family)
MHFRHRRSAGWPLRAIARRCRAVGANSGRRVRAGVIAAALTGSALSAVALATVVPAGRALAAPARPAPAGPQYPATWTVRGNVATGTTPSGVVVTATLTGPAAWFAVPTGPLVLTGPTPGYFPSTTTQALLPEITGCGGQVAALANGPSCGSMTYSFSRPVMAPVLYIGDIGTGSIDAGIFLDYHDSPVTLASGTFSLASADSETPNTSIWNGGATVGITDPAAEVGKSGVNASSCGTFGCGAYDIITATQTVTHLTLNYGYAGTGTSEDVFSQILAITPTTPALTLQKSVRPLVAAGAGTTVTFSYLITNTGNVPLIDVHPQETSFSGTGTPSAITCRAAIPTTRSDVRSPPQPGFTLFPGQHETCTDTYKLTQADADAGKVTNIATATGTPLSGPAVSSSPSSATVTIPAHPAIVIKKSASPGTFDAAGTAIHYSYLVTNTGNVTLTGVKVNDLLPGLSSIGCPSATLNPGKDMTCTATYMTTEADVQAGTVANTATVTGDPPSGSPVVSAPSTVVIAAPAPVHRGTPVPVTG